MSRSASAPRPAFWRIRESLEPTTQWLLSLAMPLLLWLVWWWLTRESHPGQVESRIVNINILPSPREMFARDTLHSLWFDRELSRSALVSLGRVCSGFAIASAIALPLGVAMGAFTKMGALFRLPMLAGGYLPVAALVPLTLVWFGTGESQKIGFLAIAVLVYLLPMVVAAVEQVDEVLLQTAQTQGAGRWHLVSRVLVPVAAPGIYHGLRLAFGVAWSWIILAEVVAAERGLGFIINTAQGRGTNMAHVYLTLATIILLAFALDRLWAAGSALLFPYKRDQHG